MHTYHICLRESRLRIARARPKRSERKSLRRNAFARNALAYRLIRSVAAFEELPNRSACFAGRAADCLATSLLSISTRRRGPGNLLLSCSVIELLGVQRR